MIRLEKGQSQLNLHWPKKLCLALKSWNMGIVWHVSRSCYDVKIEIQLRRFQPHKGCRSKGRKQKVTFEPAVIGVDVVCDVPTLHDLRSDYQRLQDVLAAAGYPKCNLRYGSFSRSFRPVAPRELACSGGFSR